MKDNSDNKIKLVVASTGGSGVGYLLRLFYHLLDVPGETHWIPSGNFFRVYESECGKTPVESIYKSVMDLLRQNYSIEGIEARHRFYFHDYRDITAAPSSGSAVFDAMVVIPCSMKTLGAIAAGISSNLIERAADVCLKERRRLILVPRETPYSLIHVENMRTVTLAGAVVMPASPGFYNRPSTIEELYDFMVDRVFLQAGIQKRIVKPWGDGT